MRAVLADPNILGIRPRNTERSRYCRCRDLGQKWLNSLHVGFLIKPSRLARGVPARPRGGIAALGLCNASTNLGSLSDYAPAFSCFRYSFTGSGGSACRAY